MYLTGESAGRNGTTTFVMKRVKLRSVYTDKLLFQGLFEELSSIAMNGNTYMTEEAWKEMKPKLVGVYSNMPVAQDNPKWWIIDIFDGFGVHLCNLEVLEHCFDKNSLSIKEERG